MRTKDCFDLYEYAYQFFDSKLWKKMYEGELFAIHLPSGQLGYCTVLGNGGTHFALNVYKGSSGLSSLRRMLESIDEDERIAFFQQDCYVVSFEEKDLLSPEEQVLAHEYCKLKKRKKQRLNPHFQRLEPNYMPRTIPVGHRDMEILLDALRVVCGLAELLKTHTKAQLLLNPIALNTDGDRYAVLAPASGGKVKIPVYTMTDDTMFRIDQAELPAYREQRCRKPKPLDEALLNKIRKFRKRGCLLCDIRRMFFPVSEETPYIPAMLICYDREEAIDLAPVLAQGAVYDSTRLLNDFADRLIEQKACPFEIRYRTRETHTLLNDFCEKAGIRLVYDDDLEEIDLTEEILSNQFDRLAETDLSEEEIIAQMIREFSDEELEMMPDHVRQGILEHPEMLPEDAIARLRKGSSKKE